MIKLVTDENFTEPIIRRLRQQSSNFDIVRVQDVGLRTSDDPTILEWAANNNRIVLTHDIATMPDFAYDRVYKGLPMPGMLAVPKTAVFSEVIESLLLIAEDSNEDDWKDRVTFLPL